METMINLKDLLKHEILDLYSAEEQIIDALPAMIEKAGDSSLKKALNDHLKVTKEQKKRLDKVKDLMRNEGENLQDDNEKKGFFSRLFSGAGAQKCKGMEGLITEGEKLMGEDMNEDVMDAAIIASAQKIEHYEISGYGTARAYARELKLEQVRKLLEQSLNEEYEADDLLTQLAVGRLNIEAENATGENDEEKTKKPAKQSVRELSKSSGTSKKSSSKSTGNSSAKSSSSNKGSSKKQTSSKTSGKTKSGTSNKSSGRKSTSRSGTGSR